MNFAYFRKSNYSLEDTVKHVTENAKKQEFKILAESDLPDDHGKMVVICKKDWLGTLLKENYNLVGFLPCSIIVMKQDDAVMVGTGQPAIIKAIAQTKQLTELADNAEKVIKAIIHTSAGVSELKPTVVKLYSTMSCPYCKMEKSWLESKQVKHDVVYVDLNEAEANKMVERTGQMGVPVTEIQYEDGEPEFIVGFEKSKLASILGVEE
jgi:glutaredoxin/uncharacterized protein (DUF302 family)